jgi:hypothetical protein
MTSTAAPTSPGAPAENPARAGRRRSFWVGAAVLGVLVVLVLVGLHLIALNGYHSSFDTQASLQQRSAGASLAHQLEPWNAQFATRATVMQKWQHGVLNLSQGAYLPAMLELADACRLDVGDKELLARFQISQDLLTLHSNFKAHVQHGHEGTGGTLRPQDLLP